MTSAGVAVLIVGPDEPEPKPPPLRVPANGLPRRAASAGSKGADLETRVAGFFLPRPWQERGWLEPSQSANKPQIDAGRFGAAMTR